MSTPRRAVRPVDDVWLAMDQPDNLMVVESLMAVDGDLDRATYLELLRERVLDRFPRFRQRARWSWLPRPGLWWEEDPGFDLERHVHEVTLPAPGDDATLQDYVSRHLSRALDRGHPPWEAHVVRGYRGGSAVYTRLHHALADGNALFRVVMAMADEDLDLGAGQADGRADGQDAGQAAGALSRLRALPGAAARSASGARRLATTPVVAEHLVVARRPASPLSGPPHHAKRAVWAPPIDVADLRPIRRATGTTVTDVVMSAVAGSLRRWLTAHGAAPAEDLPTMVPVDLGGSAAQRPDDLGNQFALVLLDLPVGLDSARERLAETAARMAAIKRSPQAWLTYGMLQAMGVVHPRARVLATDFFARKATGVTTSVRGPDAPLHLAGLPVTRMWAWAPMSADQTLSTSIIGYGGQVHVGFKVDAAAVPDPETLVAGLRAELDELAAL
ncbi:wax ester/triacylglycerol synthase family O-acyltransferase [Nocardioides sp. GY 10113]|uniref:wax ester/triacylglycerol synthase family O-acyltransferase n=1 Tax=Nocardioides sp. GY 10113 TaxID=2569761 RepID=UPI0010A794F5|nr:wax ester/triacylglycerol synthase family O-acyltransferase [Nocardioides sp. GY 10113]TIC87994.1 wax ester/triacylglycerol synthase family O-acyltransferase [Nocardioides sp. GY 10113]